MADAWHDEVPEDAFNTDANKIYRESLAIVKGGLNKGLDFHSACAALDIPEKALREGIIDDILKVCIAEEHFAKNLPLARLAERLNLPLDRLEKARAEMLEDVENTTVNALYKDIEKGTEH